jgi:hypothetical protein
LFPRFRVAGDGGVKTSPLPTDGAVTAIVELPESGVNALIVIVAGAPGPVTVLHVTGPETVPVSTKGEVTVSTTLAVMSATPPVWLNWITVVLLPFPVQLAAEFTV